MIGLVDYGSGSESDSDGETVQQQAVIRTQNGPEKTRGVFDEEESFSANTGSSLNLPSATNGTITNHQTEENELEGVVKPRDWEQELAEKNKKKLEKRAKKKEKKEKKHKKNKGDKAEKKEKKPVNKTKISAFGALGTLGAESDSDEEEHEAKPEATRSTTSSSKSALLNLLPAPKAKTKSSSVFGKGTGGSSMLLPSTLRKTPAAAAPKVQPATSSLVSKRKIESDESDDDDVTDFFGLTVAPEVKRTRVDEEREIPLMATGTGFESFGPSKPSEEEEMHPSQMYNYADVDIDELPQRRAGFISDEQAFNLISRDETVQVGDRRTLNEITAGIIDVSVDQALGPSVQSSLLKQVTKQAYIRDVNALPAKTGTVDKVARQKHQITYLAKLAVAREAALEEQWASSKNQKRMARQKYGF